jgi:hypothetical protein
MFDGGKKIIKPGIMVQDQKTDILCVIKSIGEPI